MMVTVKKRMSCAKPVRNNNLRNNLHGTIFSMSNEMSPISVKNFLGNKS